MGSSSPVFRPSPREPPDPTAGFNFRPATQPLSWRQPPRRSSHESPHDPAGPHSSTRFASSSADYTDRPSSWVGMGESAATTGRSGHMMGSSRHPEAESWRRTEGGRQPGATWHLPTKSETEPQREHLLESPRLPFGFELPRPRELPPADAVEERHGVWEAHTRGGSPSTGQRRVFPRTRETVLEQRQVEINPERLAGGPSYQDEKGGTGGGGAYQDPPWTGHERQRLESGRQGDSQQDHERFPPSAVGIGSAMPSTGLTESVRYPSGGSAAAGVVATLPSRRKIEEMPPPTPEFVEGSPHQTSETGGGHQRQWSDGMSGKRNHQQGGNTLGTLSRERPHGRLPVASAASSLIEGSGQHREAKAVASSASASQSVEFKREETRPHSSDVVGDNRRGQEDDEYARRGSQTTVARSLTPPHSRVTGTAAADVRVLGTPRRDPEEQRRGEVWHPPSGDQPASHRGREELSDQQQGPSRQVSQQSRWEGPTGGEYKG